MIEGENIYDQIESLKRRVSLLEDCAELEKAEPKKTEEASSDVDAWLDGDGCYISSACRGAARDAWFTCATYLKSKHDAELMRAFVQGSNWEYDRAGSEDPSERAKGMLAAGTLGKP